MHQLVAHELVTHQLVKHLQLVAKLVDQFCSQLMDFFIRYP